MSQTDADVVPLPEGSSPLEFLAPPVPGYFCPCCDFTTINWDVLGLHFRQTQCARGHKTREDFLCFLQRWVSFRRNVGGTWRVRRAKPTDQSEIKAAQCWDHHDMDDAATTALLQMEAEEEARLLREEHEFMSLSNELEHDENTDWLRGCGWPRWFAHKPLHLIIATSRAPPSRNQTFHLGTWNGMNWTSCKATEAKLRRLLEIVSLAMDRCEETLAQTPRAMRCWLRSWGSHFYAYPFELPQRAATRARYRSYLNRFLCYVFRSWQVCQALSQSLEEVYGLRLSQAQAQGMESV